MSDVIDRLAALIEARKDSDETSSYTASLFAKGREKCAEKFGEEAVEAIVASVKNDKKSLTSEAADVLYHLLVMLSASDVTLSDVRQELETREGVSGHDEKASRK